MLPHSRPLIPPPKVVTVARQAFQEMPHNFEAEQGLLGMLLIDNTHLERVNDFLRPDHFSHPSHQNIYATIEKMIERGLEAKHTTLKDYFEKDGRIRICRRCPIFSRAGQ